MTEPRITAIHFVEGLVKGERYKVVRRPSGRAVTGTLEFVWTTGRGISLVDGAGRRHWIDADDMVSIEHIPA